MDEVGNFISISTILSIFTKGDQGVPLQHVDARAWLDGAGVRFSMQDHGRDVRCYVYQGALDIIERSVTIDLLDRFERHRATFEAIASDLHDAGLPVRITADHVVRLRKS